jgi:signal transduction histidine kinase
VTITDLYPIFIIVGVTIITATGWLLHQYRMQLLNTQELIQLNEQLGYDLPDFLRQCWPGLKKCGFHGLYWHLDWFGTEVSGQDGDLEDEVIAKEFEVHEVKLSIRLYREKRDWEQGYFINAQAENFFLLLRMSLWIKLGSVHGAFDQAAKMTVLLKHDVKNMVQLLSFTADQLADTDPDREKKLLNNLREAIPAVRDRAEHMLRALTDKPTRRQLGDSTNPEAPVSLSRILIQTAKIYDLDATIEGEAQTIIEKEVLQSIIDNLLGNYSRLEKKAGMPATHLRVIIEQNESMSLIYIEDLNGRQFPQPERLFEPFWSEHGGGRGIGLYQARQQVMALGGNLNVIAEPDKALRFVLALPRHL